MLWLDGTDPAVRSAIVSGAWGRSPHSAHGFQIPTPPTIDTIANSLDVASDILTRLTAFAIHPAIAVEEDFVAAPQVTKLYPSFSPVRSVTSVTRLGVDGSTPQQPSGWTAFGGAIYFSPDCSMMFGSWFRGFYSLYGPVGYASCLREREFLRVAYHAGSTITASARSAVIALAHDIWLDGNSCEECGLPQRTTSVAREGISYNLSDPSDPTLNALTGIPSVDIWVRSVNPRRAVRSAAVYTPDSPPPVVRSVRTARPEWGSTVHLAGDVHVNISTASA